MPKNPGPKASSDVFGVSDVVLPDSYVDRGNLDEELTRELGRRTHVALQGPSKCGKSWLRRNVIPDAIVVQCRLGMEVLDIYRAALSELGVKLIVTSTAGTSFAGRLEAERWVSENSLGKLGIRGGVEADTESSATTEPVGRDINDLKFVAELLKASERRLVIEDFTMTEEVRRTCLRPQGVVGLRPLRLFSCT